MFSTSHGVAPWSSAAFGARAHDMALTLASFCRLLSPRGSLAALEQDRRRAENRGLGECPCSFVAVVAAEPLTFLRLTVRDFRLWVFVAVVSTVVSAGLAYSVSDARIALLTAFTVIITATFTAAGSQVGGAAPK